MTDTAAAIKDIFTRMPGRLDPQAAAGLDAVIQFNLSGEGGGVWHCAIKDGACTVGEGAHDAPTMTDGGRRLRGADVGGPGRDRPFMSGKLRIDGDMGLAMRMGSLFRVG